MESALSLRLSGLTYREIGERLGVSRQRIQQLLAPPTAIRQVVVDRADGLCERCGITVGRGGHVHHKNSSGVTCDQYQDLANLVLLCPACHRAAHCAPRAGTQSKKLRPLVRCDFCDHLWSVRIPRPTRCPKCFRVLLQAPKVVKS